MFIIAICGGSGSGKTRFSKGLKNIINKNMSVEIISTDNFYKDYDDYTEKQKCDFHNDNLDYDDPNLMDTDLLMEVLFTLKCGRNARIPIYNFDIYKREKDKYSVISSNIDVIILEGIFTLSFDNLCEMYDISLFIDTPIDVCLGRRLVRNSEERNGPFGDFSIAREFNYYKRFTMPFYKENKDKMMEKATFIVKGTKDDYKIIYKLICNYFIIELKNDNLIERNI